MNFKDELAPKRQYLSADLFHQSPKTIIANASVRNKLINFSLYLIKNLLDIYKLFYLKSQYDKFDPNVGDTSCQIRAAIVAFFAVSKPNRNYVTSRIRSFHFAYKMITEHMMDEAIHCYTGKNHQDTILQFLDKIGALFFISEEEWFLYQAYFLSIYKINTINNQSTINILGICSHLGISKKSAKKLTRMYQINISDFSCETIKKMAYYLSDNEKKLSYISRVDEFGRQVIPCYLSMKIILGYLIKKEINILVLIYHKTGFSIKKLPLIFKPNNLRNKYIYSSIDPHKMKNPVFMVVGSSKSFLESEHLKNVFIHIGIENILLANLSTHSQFSSKKLYSYWNKPFHDINQYPKIINEFNKELEDMQKISWEHGCHQGDNSLFLAQHIFCSTPSAALKHTRSLTPEIEL